MWEPRWQEHTLPSPDEPIHWREAGDGPAVLLINGLGGDWRIWRPLVAGFPSGARFVTWDYRRLKAAGATADAPSLNFFAEDAQRVLDGAGVNRAAVWAWSLGVPVALELFRQAPERVASLVLMNGQPGRHLGVDWQAPSLAAAVPGVVRALTGLPRLAQQLVGRAARWPETVSWAKRLGVVGAQLQEEAWSDAVRYVASLDMRRLRELLRDVAQQDARAELEALDVPTLVAGGERDAFVPPKALERLARAIRAADLYIVPGATHYALIEQPELLQLRIQKFLAERAAPLTGRRAGEGGVR